MTWPGLAEMVRCARSLISETEQPLSRCGRRASPRFYSRPESPIRRSSAWRTESMT